MTAWSLLIAFCISTESGAYLLSRSFSTVFFAIASKSVVHLLEDFTQAFVLL